MKKLLFRVLLVVLLVFAMFAFTTTVFAADTAPPGEADGFISIAMLGLFSVRVAIVVGLTQLLKMKLVKIEPKLLVAIVALIVQISIELIFKPQINAQGVYLAAINAIPLSLTSIGSYEVGVKPFVNKYLENKAINTIDASKDDSGG